MIGFLFIFNVINCSSLINVLTCGLFNMCVKLGNDDEETNTEIKSEPKIVTNNEAGLSDSNLALFATKTSIENLNPVLEPPSLDQNSSQEPDLGKDKAELTTEIFNEIDKKSKDTATSEIDDISFENENGFLSD